MGDIADDMIEQMWSWEPDLGDPEYFYEAMTCPYCGARGVRKHHRHVYKRTIPGAHDVIVCSNYPTCDSYVGCHRDGRSKGPMANAELRSARKAAHDAFDLLWRRGFAARNMSRSDAYLWLSGQLDLRADECHMGKMTEIDMLHEVVRISERRLGAPARQIRARDDFKFA